MGLEGKMGRVTNCIDYIYRSLGDEIFFEGGLGIAVRYAARSLMFPMILTRRAYPAAPEGPRPRGPGR